MGAKTKAQRENLSLFAEDDQESNQIEPTTPQEALLGSSDPEARQLFDLAIGIKELKPWRWMEETDLIGIENPETGEIGFISVMAPSANMRPWLFILVLRVSTASSICSRT